MLETLKYLDLIATLILGIATLVARCIWKMYDENRKVHRELKEKLESLQVTLRTEYVRAKEIPPQWFVKQVEKNERRLDALEAAFRESQRKG